MRLNRVRWVVAVAAVMSVALMGQTAFAQKQYTAYNMWFEKPERLYAINYKAGNIIPAGRKSRTYRWARAAAVFCAGAR